MKIYDFRNNKLKEMDINPKIASPDNLSGKIVKIYYGDNDFQFAFLCLAKAFLRKHYYKSKITKAEFLIEFEKVLLNINELAKPELEEWFGRPLSKEQIDYMLSRLKKSNITIFNKYTPEDFGNSEYLFLDFERKNAWIE